MIDYIILLSAVLKCAVISRKLWKIASFSIVIDLWKHVEFVCVSMCVHTQFREKEFDCLPFKGFVDFCPKISRNLEVKRDYITKMYHF